MDIFGFEKKRAAIEALKQVIRPGVRAGFRAHADILESAIDCGEDEGAPRAFVLRQAHAILAAEISAVRAEQASWPARTDFDRLEAAFETLEASGIVCRHDFSCCGTCASVEIWDEMEAEREAGRVIRGAAHYNEQTTEGAVDGDGLWFSYASVAEGKEALASIGHEIQAAMEGAGLEVEWSGSTANSIHVMLDWKRRLPAR